MSVFSSRIRLLRRQQKRTLKEVANQCGFTESLLSKIEAGKTNPPLATLTRIAGALGVQLGDLLDEGRPLATVFSPATELEKRVETRTAKGYGFQVLAAQRAGKIMQPFLFVAEKDGVKPGTLSHMGEEFIYVLEGSMRYRVGATTYQWPGGNHCDAQRRQFLAQRGCEIQWREFASRQLRFDDPNQGERAARRFNRPNQRDRQRGTLASATAFKITPKISGFSPSIGHIGDQITIFGTGFNGATAVKFNAISASFSVQSSTQITATVPAKAKTGKISVTTPSGTTPSGTTPSGTTPSGTTSSASVFTVTSPLLLSFSPTRGPVGTSVTLNGANYSSATIINFNGVPSPSPTLISATQLAAIVPANATTGKISVINADGQSATSSSNFGVKPKLTAFTPSMGAPGQSVILTGSGFLGATSVKFNGTITISTLDSSTQITALVPASATTGVISVTTAGGSVTGSNTFTVASRLSSFLPSSGSAASIVTLAGANFTGTTQVFFNGMSAGPQVGDITTANAGFQIVSTTQIKVKVALGAITGKISVSTPAGTALSATNFTVIASAPLAAPDQPSTPSA